MDPEAALNSLDQALAARDQEGIFEYSDALFGWINSGGFLPFLSGDSDWRSDLNRDQVLKYLFDVRSATGIDQNGEDVK